MCMLVGQSDLFVAHRNVNLLQKANLDGKNDIATKCPFLDEMFSYPTNLSEKRAPEANVNENIFILLNRTARL